MVSGPGVVATIATADCVPVVVVGRRRGAAIHAGWRGVAGGVVDAALAVLEEDAALLRAWIGPAIGACCYEVGEEVAAAVVAASSPEAREDGHGAKPHLDLQRAVELQLRRAGVREIERFERCTRCHPDELWSYRRDGPRAGRNLALLWRERGR